MNFIYWFSFSNVYRNCTRGVYKSKPSPSYITEPKVCLEFNCIWALFVCESGYKDCWKHTGSGDHGKNKRHKKATVVDDGLKDQEPGEPFGDSGSHSMPEKRVEDLSSMERGDNILAMKRRKLHWGYAISHLLSLTYLLEWVRSELKKKHTYMEMMTGNSQYVSCFCRKLYRVCYFLST